MKGSVTGGLDTGARERGGAQRWVMEDVCEVPDH